eukprot:2906393-Prymnesium_polylepis.1
MQLPEDFHHGCPHRDSNNGQSVARAQDRSSSPCEGTRPRETKQFEASEQSEKLRRWENELGVPAAQPHESDGQLKRLPRLVLLDHTER